MSNISNEQNPQEKSIEKNSEENPKPPSIDIKKLLSKLLKQSLDDRLKRLEKRNKEQLADLEITKKYFNAFTRSVNALVKNAEETKKRREEEEKQKTNTPKRLKPNIGIKTRNQTVENPHRRKKKIEEEQMNKTHANYYSNRNKEKEKKAISSSTNFLTEENEHKRSKTAKSSRLVSGIDLKKVTKIIKPKKTDKTLFSPTKKLNLEKDEKKKLSTYKTESNSLSKSRVNKDKKNDDIISGRSKQNLKLTFKKENAKSEKKTEVKLKSAKSKEKIKDQKKKEKENIHNIETIKKCAAVSEKNGY